jgi:GT2 family glycosyltransferase
MDGQIGPIAARNWIAEQATGEYLLSLDDDTEILDPNAVARAVEVLRADERVGAVAFAQGNADGSGWPAWAQPAPVPYSCRVTAFIGCAVLLRRNLFVRLGGYQEMLEYYGEEKEYCLRLLSAGYAVVYLPDARVAHLADPANRDPVKYFRYYTRNDCLTALFDFPWPVALAVVGARLARYYRTARRHIQMDDPGGRSWLWEEIRSKWGAIRRGRRSVGWSTLWKWHRLKKTWPAYLADEDGR